LLLVGRKGGPEVRLVPAEGFDLATVNVRGLDRDALWKNLALPVVVPAALGGGLRIVDRFKPDVVLGMGGYVMAPAVAAARMRDTYTLWNLLPRVDGDNRVLVYERMAALVPPPDGVTREGVLALNQQMLDVWKLKLESSWGNNSSPTMKSLKKIWTTGLGEINGLQGKR